MQETVYKIKDWNEVFEKFDTRRLKLGLSYVTWPTSQDSEGFLFLSRSPEGHIALAMFGALVQLAGKRKQGQRGVLADDSGKPITADRYSNRFGLPIEHARAAWNLLTSPQVGWLVPLEAPVCNVDAPCMHHVCSAHDRIEESRGEESFVSNAGGRERTFDERATMRYGNQAGQALWDEWCADKTLPRAGKAAGINAAQRVTEFIAEQRWAAAGGTGSVRDFMDGARDWLKERVSRWRQSPMAKRQGSEGKWAANWFNEARYDDDDSAWEQTPVRSSGSGRQARPNLSDGSYADEQTVLPEI